VQPGAATCNACISTCPVIPVTIVFLQGYIISDKIGREGSGNIFTHNVPPGHDVISLVINCDGTLEFS
jgi:hypothetical protein